MEKIHYAQLSIALIALAIAGCATQGSGSKPLAAAIDHGSASSASAVQSSDTGTVAADIPAGTATIGLVDILEHRLGVSQQQALSGAGAIFQLAQNNMAPDAFAAMARSIPGMNQMLSAAPPMSNLASGLSSLMGDKNQTLSSVAALAASFQQLDLAPDMVGRFIPIIANYVRQASGEVTANLLQAALTAH